MIKRVKVAKNVWNKKQKQNIVPTDIDRKAMYLAIRLGFVTLRTLEEVIYTNHQERRNVSKRMIDLVVHGYFRKMSYVGPGYGSQARFDHRSYLPGIKAMRHLGLEGIPPRVDKSNAWSIYCTDNLIHQLYRCGISYDDVYTSVQIKRDSVLTTYENKNSIITGNIPLKEKGMPFHLAIRGPRNYRDDNDTFIYIFFYRRK